MPSCYLRTASAMLLGRSCGGLNISHGRCSKVRNTLRSLICYLSSNHVPWTIIGVCVFTCILLLFAIRVLLARENKRRDAEPRDDSYDDVHVVKTNEDGNRVLVKVSKVRVRSHDGAYFAV